MLYFVASVGSAYEDEDALAAAFVYRLATMTSWPEESTDEWSATVCFAVVGDGAVADALKETVRSRQLCGHEVEVRDLASVIGAADCVVAYVQNSLVRDLLASTASTSTLTIGHADDFVEKGGMIQLIREGQRLRFSVNRTAISDRGLTMSSKVLRLAVSVK